MCVLWERFPVRRDVLTSSNVNFSIFFSHVYIYMFMLRIQCLAYERQEQTKRGFSFPPGGMFIPACSFLFTRLFAFDHSYPPRTSCVAAPQGSKQPVS